MQTKMTHDEMRSVRTDYYKKEEIYALMQSVSLSMVATATVALSKYATGLYVLDSSDYQGKADGTTGVDWDTIAKDAPWIVGGYCKLGEVGDKGYYTEDGGMETTFDSNLDGLARNHMWAGAYIFVNTAWYGPQSGIDLVETESWNRGTEEETFTRVINDVHVHLIMRRLFPIGKKISPQLTLADLQKMSCKRVMALILDIERSWKWYPISSNDGTPNTVVNGIVIASVTKQLAAKLQWLMDHMALPQMPIIIYSGEGFIGTYSNQLRAVADYYDTICAHYYWQQKYTPTTWDGIRNTYLPQISATWKPYLFGGYEPYGKQVCFLQLSGDKFAVKDVVNDRGMMSALDLNYCYFPTVEVMAKKFTRWTDWKEFGTGVIVPPIDPPVEPPPVIPPVPNFETWATVLSGANNMPLAIGFRPQADNVPNTFITLDGRIRTGFKSKVSGSAVDRLGRTWYDLEVRGWACAGENGVPYISIEKKQI
jgi:hypothetical protein